jgi:hypothetical protein
MLTIVINSFLNQPDPQLSGFGDLMMESLKSESSVADKFSVGRGARR